MLTKQFFKLDTNYKRRSLDSTNYYVFYINYLLT